MREASASLRARPLRSFFTGLGTLVAIAAFVATACIAETARAQLSSRFDALEAREVEVQFQPDEPYPHEFTAGGLAALGRLNGVQAAGQTFPVTTEGTDIDITRSPRPSGWTDGSTQIPIAAADPGALDAWLLEASAGRLYDAFHEGRAERVVIVGSAAAVKLGLTRVDNQPAIFIAGIPFVVLGVFESSPRDPLLLSSILMPVSTAKQSFPGRDVDAKVVIDTSSGAAQLIARQAALALRPDRPDLLDVLAPPDPRTLRSQIEGDAVRIVYSVSGVALLMGAIGIANSAALAVVERRHEIGLRRSLGATRGNIWRLIAQETALLGGVAAAVGAVMGLFLAVAYSIVQGWVPTGDPLLVACTPIIGIVVGAIAGVVPAIQASRTPPAVTLRT